jgi:hypothetical protein
MTQEAQGKTAKIYQFPVGGRAGVATTREQPKHLEVPRPARAGARIVHGPTWYHEEAILDDADVPRTR